MISNTNTLNNNTSFITVWKWTMELYVMAIHHLLWCPQTVWKFPSTAHIDFHRPFEMETHDLSHRKALSIIHFHIKAYNSHLAWIWRWPGTNVYHVNWEKPTLASISKWVFEGVWTNSIIYCSWYLVGSCRVSK